MSVVTEPKKTQTWDQVYSFKDVDVLFTLLRDEKGLYCTMYSPDGFRIG